MSSATRGSEDGNDVGIASDGSNGEQEELERLAEREDATGWIARAMLSGKT